MTQPLDPNTPLSATLTASEWNVVLAGLDELPQKFSRAVTDKLRCQLDAAAESTAPAPIEQLKSNGQQAIVNG
jgi:hypothetical protein